MTYRPRAAALPALSCAALALLAGCAGDTAFPSLAPRPIEAIARQPERTVTAPVPVGDSALETQVTALETELKDAALEWSSTAATTRTAVGRARGAAVGSEGWIVAQQAVSRLDAIRERTAKVTEALDQLRIDRAQAAKVIDTARLDRIWAASVAQGEAQDTEYAALLAGLKSA
ncbi:hypothetical protein ACFSGX_08080 [Sphingomonas arantia]|uniref:Lipoprotein n=1 Tax=Sphingomonas arantia TaxID=1460676 RepID=A0ABW4TYT9_9SPHN